MLPFSATGRTDPGEAGGFDRGGESENPAERLSQSLRQEMMVPCTKMVVEKKVNQSIQ